MPRLRAHLAPLALFSFLTLLLAFPIVAGLGSAVPGWEGDNLYYVRSMWWVKHAIVDLRISPFFDPTSFHPVGEHIARSEMTAANTVLGLPITAAWSPEAAYSLVVLFSFVATAMGTYFWVRHLTGSRIAGMVAGTIAAFLPMRFAHLPGHLPQITTQWVPWTLFAFERFLDRRTLARGAALGAFAALVVLGCWYYGYALMLLLPVYAVARTWHHRGVWRDAAWWRGLAAGGAIAIVFVLPFMLQMLKLSGAGELKRTIIEMDEWSVNPYDFFIPSVLHPVWGGAVSSRFPVQRALSVERQISLGYVAAVLAIAGLRRTGARRIARALAVVWIASFAIALGPTLHWNDQQVRFWVPRIVVAAIVRTLEFIGGAEPTHPLRSQIASTQFTPIFLPSLFLYLWVPLTSSMRIMSRFGLWTGLMTAALAGFGTIAVAERAALRFGRRARVVVALVLVAAVAFESRSVVEMIRVAPRDVDRWLAAQPKETVVVELPVDQAIRYFQNYWATVHQRSMVFGWNGDSFPPPEYWQRFAALAAFPSPDTIAFLRSIGTTYVLITPSEIPDWRNFEARLIASDLPLVGRFGEVRVYGVSAPALNEHSR